tara:strand:- start:164 stop:448 length:285 start_codon:yes stop_codon:yes gene_type:complete
MLLSIAFNIMKSKGPIKKFTNRVKEIAGNIKESRNSRVSYRDWAEEFYEGKTTKKRAAANFERQAKVTRDIPLPTSKPVKISMPRPALNIGSKK